MTHIPQRPGARRRGLHVGPLLRGAATVAAFSLALASCNTDRILHVEDPDVATSGSLTSPSALPVLLAGAVADFHNGFIGTGSGNETTGMVGYGGLLADEIRSSDTFPTRNEIDFRDVQENNGSNETEFFRISRARQSADRASAAYARLGPDSTNASLAHSLSGFATLLIAETYCSGVPFSTVDEAGNITLGQPLSSAEMFQRAVTEFDAAISGPTTGTLTELALVGRARAKLDLGDFTGAAADANGVGDSFEYVIESSATSNSENNGIWSFFFNVRRFAIPNVEGTNGLPYISDADPRVPVDNDSSRLGFDQVTPQAQQLKYTLREDPTVLADGREARLIEAEAALQAGDDATFLAKINTARAIDGVAALGSVPAAQADKENLLFKERAYALWLTGHRLGDLRRLVRQYGRAQNTVFPAGTWFRGPSLAAPNDTQTYGDDVSLPVPSTERNNPNFTGCDTSVP